jgi:protein-L-isoaspartate(D-aspartate) O-methyltransferase
MKMSRILLCALSLGVVVNLAHAAVDASQPDWNYERYQTLMKESGRKPGISETTFNELRERRKEAIKITEKYLTERLGKADPAVLRAFEQLPREYYHYNYQTGSSIAGVAYEIDNIKPWAIGYGSALSDYLGQAYMTQLTQPTPDKIALEVGTGSGYQSSLLSRIVKKVHSIEIIEPLGKGVAKIYKPLGYDNVETRVGDGFFGWPEVKGGFDIIIVTCAAQYIPPALVDQLKPGGRMIVPVGQPFKKGQILYIVTKDEKGQVRTKKDVGVYFIPMTGAIEKQATPDAAPVKN